MKIAAVLLSIAALSACTRSGPGTESPAGHGAGAGGADSSGAGGAAGSENAGEGGASGTSPTSGMGGATAGTGGASGTGGSSGDSSGGSGGAMTGGEGGSAGAVSEDAGVPPATGFDPDGCVVARRIDECCQPWLAVEQAIAQAEPCIVALGEPWPEGRLLAFCMPEENCALVDCAVPSTPTSREVLRGDGACLFTDECMTEADCVLAAESTSCCACHVSMPKILVEQELCITTEGETPDFAVCGGDDCSTVLCAECEAPAEPTCALSDGYKRCR
jgi:hypothetical protein